MHGPLQLFKAIQRANLWNPSKLDLSGRLQTKKLDGCFWFYRLSHFLSVLVTGFDIFKLRLFLLLYMVLYHIQTTRSVLQVSKRKPGRWRFASNQVVIRVEERCDLRQNRWRFTFVFVTILENKKVFWFTILTLTLSARFTIHVCQ